MKYSKFIIGAVAVVAMALTAAAFTRGHHHDQGGYGDRDMSMNDDDRGGRGGKGFRDGNQLATTIDANGNHIVSDEVMARMAARAFRRQDQNRDDALTQDEYIYKPSRWFNTGTTTDTQNDAVKKRFAETDLDKNNLVSKLEFMTAERARYMAADTDKDGKISAWEFHSMTRPFS